MNYELIFALIGLCLVYSAGQITWIKEYIQQRLSAYRQKEADKQELFYKFMGAYHKANRENRSFIDVVEEEKLLLMVDKKDPNTRA